MIQILGNTIEDYLIAIGQREIACIQQLTRWPKPEGLFYGPGSYQPTPASKLSVLYDYLQVARYLVPRDTSVHSSSLWHSDLNVDNIFVRPEDPTEIVGIIDWQSVHLAPLYLQVCVPAFLDFQGPKPEGLKVPSLPENFDDLTPHEQKRAETLMAEQTRWKLYEVGSAMNNSRVSRASRYQDTLGGQIISLVGYILNDGEPIVKGQLIQLTRDWLKLFTGRPDPLPCPLRYSPDEIGRQQVDEYKWVRGIEMMDAVLDSIGNAQRGWNGWVKREDYAVMRGKLQRVFEEFLDVVANNDEERARWSEVWPFGEPYPKVLCDAYRQEK